MLYTLAFLAVVAKVLEWSSKRGSDRSLKDAPPEVQQLRSSERSKIIKGWKVDEATGTLLRRRSNGRNAADSWHPVVPMEEVPAFLEQQHTASGDMKGETLYLHVSGGHGRSVQMQLAQLLGMQVP